MPDSDPQRVAEIRARLARAERRRELAETAQEAREAAPPASAGDSDAGRVDHTHRPAPSLPFGPPRRLWPSSQPPNDR